MNAKKTILDSVVTHFTQYRFTYFQAEDDAKYSEYAPLAVHLADDYYLNHQLTCLGIHVIVTVHLVHHVEEVT